MTKYLPRIFLITLVALILIGIISARHLQLESLRNPCNVLLGGTVCYNEAGTLIGITPDEYGFQLKTQSARSLNECQTTQAAIVVTPGSSPQLVIAVPVASLHNSPHGDNLLATDNPRVYCGEVFSVVNQTRTEGGHLWYEVVTTDTITGWLIAEDVKLISSGRKTP